MNDDQIARLLQDLVRIPSVNPHGNPGTSKTGEAGMVEYLADYFRKLALDVEIHEVEPGRANLIGKFTSRGSKRSVAFAPHTDTVSVAGMTIDPFGGEIRAGKLYGRGATDTKGSLAAFLAALTNAMRQKEFREGDLDVYFCALMGEESGNDGARALAARGFKPDFLIAGEPTGCRVVNAHKGSLWFKLITRGKSIHASMPDGGENAIAKMAEVIRALPRGCTVTVIRGGSQTNIVPDHCEIEIDRRTMPGEDHAQILAECAKLGEVQAARDCPPLFTEPGNEFVRRLTAASEAELASAPWFCDAAIFAAQGVPAVAFGPGSTAQAHTADEWVELNELFRAARIAEKFLSGFGEAQQAY
jgi:acetylornithine deacetylase/succinyl-diaminopimelate desuccinylase family protein